MRVLVLGAGATGGYFGASLIETGAEVCFLVRPQRRDVLQRDGLRIHTKAREQRYEVRAVSDLGEDLDWDLVLLSCKAYDLDSAITAIAPAMAHGARVLPLLNGLRHLDALDQAFGADKVLGGLCHISVAMQADGLIRHLGTLDRLTFGERPGQAALSKALCESLLAAPVAVTHSADIMAAMWGKFTLLSALAGITCLMRASIGQIVAVPGGQLLARRLHAECVEVARRSGCVIEDAGAAEAIHLLTAAHSPLKASMLRDVERGHRTEVEHVLGDMLDRAENLGVDTPLLTAACAQLRIHEAAVQD